MALENHQTMSVEKYFALEEQHPETRYEYIDGYVYMMAGVHFPLAAAYEDVDFTETTRSGNER